MSAAQGLIAAIGVLVSLVTFLLMRFPQYRREEFRGEPFSVRASAIAAGLVLAVCLTFVWAQGLFERSLPGP